MMKDPEKFNTEIPHLSIQCSVLLVEQDLKLGGVKSTQMMLMI